MKRFFQFALVVALIATSLVSCKEDNNGPSLIQGKTGPDTYAFGYCTNDIQGSIGISGGVEYTLGAAVKLSADDMLQHGDSIVGIRCGVAASGTDFTVYVVHDLNADESECLAVKRIGNVTGKTWEFVEFDEPIAVKDAGDIFFAYSLNTTEYAIGYNPGNGTTVDWVFAGAWQLLTSTGLPGRISIQAVMKGGDYSAHEQYNMVTEFVDAPSIVISGEKQQMTCYITNLGVKYANNVEIAYTYGGVSGLYRAENLGLMYGQSAKIELPEITTQGVGALELTVSTSTKGQSTPHVINGEQVAVEGGNYAGGIVIEHFTGQGCVNCPTGAAAIKDAIAALTPEKQERVVWISHHAGYGNDVFTLTESTEIASFFRVPGAPMAMLNRTKTNNDLGFMFVASALKYTHLQDLLSLTTFATVELEHTYNAETRQLEVTVSGVCPTAAPRINVIILQSGMIASQSGASGAYTHNNAPRAFLTSTYGDAINHSNGNYSNTYSYTLPESVGQFECIEENMEIVAFLANQDNGNYNNCSVLNSAKTPLLGGATRPYQIGRAHV